jgi:hypothetical protein
MIKDLNKIFVNAPIKANIDQWKQNTRKPLNFRVKYLSY